MSPGKHHNSAGSHLVMMASTYTLVVITPTDLNENIVSGYNWATMFQMPLSLFISLPVWKGRRIVFQIIYIYLNSLAIGHNLHLVHFGSEAYKNCSTIYNTVLQDYITKL